MGWQVLISFPGHAQPTGDKSIPDITCFAFAKHLKHFCLKWNFQYDYTTRSLYVWQMALGCTTKPNPNIWQYILINKRENITKPSSMLLVWRRAAHIHNHSFKFYLAQCLASHLFLSLHLQETKLNYQITYSKKDNWKSLVDYQDGP